MRVFISHSEEEEWLVKLIAPELERLGVTPYYYEMNEMGTLILEKIDSELQACDEVLVLLTPTSVQSPWVLGEIAVARHLKKKLVPFYMYVDEKTIPPPLMNVLRRRMGDLSLYYDELRKRMVPERIEEKVKVHETEAGEDASEPGQFAMSEVQQVVQNPYKATELLDHARRLMTSAPPALKSTPSSRERAVGETAEQPPDEAAAQPK